MSKTAVNSPSSSGDDPLESIREHEEQIEQLADREDRIGAIARYFLAVADGKTPDSYDAELAGLPKLNGGNGE